MSVIIPVFPSEPLYKERIRLEGKDYIFKFDWSDREQRYYMTISNVNEVSLLQGIKVISNWPFLERQHFNADLPPGDLMAVDFEQDGEPPTFDDFGTRVRMFYYDEGELDEAFG